MNQQQAPYVGQYQPGQQDLQFVYPYPPPPYNGAPPPAASTQQAAPYQYRPPSNPQRQHLNQQSPQFFASVQPASQSISGPQNGRHTFLAAAQQQSGQNGRPALASPALVDPGAPLPNPTSPDDGDQDDTMNDGQERPAYGPNGQDEHGAIYNIPPPPEDTFPNEDALEKAIHSWSKEHGYELVRRASKRNAKGVLYKRYYHCSKHGSRKHEVPEEMRQRASRKSNRIDCPMSLACVAVDPTEPEGEWQIRHRKTHHNHPPMEPIKLAGHRRRARMGGVEQAVDNLFAIGTGTAQVLQFLQRSNPDGLFTRTDVHNMKNKYKKWGTCADRILRGDAHKGGGNNKKKHACVPCRESRIGCAHERPHCSTCARNNKQCYYDRPETPPVNDVSNSDIPNGLPVAHEHQPDSHIDLTEEPQQDPPTIPLRNGPGRPSHATIEQTEQILASLRNFAHDHVKPTPLTLESSQVEVLAQSSCGTGELYRHLPVMNSERDWPAFKDAMSEAAMKENTWEVLTSVKKEPVKPPNAKSTGTDKEIEAWNEYIKQLAIFQRRNTLLLAALRSKLGFSFRALVQNSTSAAYVWQGLEAHCLPRGSETAYTLFTELQSINLANSTGLHNYITRLENVHEQFKKLKLNTSPWNAQQARNSGKLPSAQSGADALPEEMMVFLFLHGLGPEWQRWVEGLVATSNVGGFGTGDRLGFKEVCKRTKAAEEMYRRGVGQWAS